MPVPEGFEAEKVEFVAKTKHISLKLDGDEASFELCVILCCVKIRVKSFFPVVLGPFPSVVLLLLGGVVLCLLGALRRTKRRRF